MGMLTKATVRPKGQAAPPLEMCKDLSEHPALREFLTMDVWDHDGSHRERGTVLLFADDVGLKAMLNDKDGSRVAFSVLSPQGAILDELEAMLLSEATDWRAAKKMPGRKP
jgi:hypothetical protein